MAILDETRMSLKEAGEYFNRDGQTVRNWIKTGLRGVKLEALKIGGSLVTSREAILRFIAATNPSTGA